MKQIILDAYGGHRICVGQAIPTDNELYHQHIRQMAIDIIEWDLWEAMEGGYYDPERCKAESIYYSWAAIALHEEVICITEEYEVYNSIFFQVMTQ